MSVRTKYVCMYMYVCFKENIFQIFGFNYDF